MNYREVKSKLHMGFSLLLKPLGFVGEKDHDGSGFQRNCKFGYDYFSFGVRNYVDEFKTGCSVSLRNNEIQNVLKKALNDPLNYNDRTDTIGYRYADYLGVINFDFTIKTDADIEGWMIEAEKFILEFALPFYEKYKTVDAIDKLLNKNPEEDSVYCQFSERIMRALIAAKLNKNSDYERLVEIYQEQIDKYLTPGNFQIPKLKKVMDFLKVHTWEEIATISLSDEAA